MKRVDFDKNGILNVSERVGHYGLFRKRTYQLLVDLNTGEAVFDLSHSGDETIRFERYGNLFVLKRKKERKHFNQTVTYISIFDTVDEKIICRDLIAEDSEKYPMCFFDLTDINIVAIISQHTEQEEKIDGETIEHIE